MNIEKAEIRVPSSYGPSGGKALVVQAPLSVAVNPAAGLEARVEVRNPLQMTVFLPLLTFIANRPTFFHVLLLALTF